MRGGGGTGMRVGRQAQAHKVRGGRREPDLRLAASFGEVAVSDSEAEHSVIDAYLVGGGLVGSTAAVEGHHDPRQEPGDRPRGDGSEGDGQMAEPESGHALDDRGYLASVTGSPSVKVTQRNCPSARPALTWSSANTSR
jgi:hypothetical protein